MANLSDKFSTYGLSLATAQVEYLLNSNTDTSGTNTGAFSYGAAGQSIVAFSSSGNWVTKRVQSIVAITPQDRITLEVSEDGNEWIDASSAFPAMESGSNKYGIDIEPVDSTNLQLDIRFGGNGANGTEAWAAYVAIADGGTGAATWKWRVRVTRANLSAGFGEVSQSAAGLVQRAGQLRGTNTNDSAAAGYVGELIDSTLGSFTGAMGDLTVYTLAQITLTPGDWDVCGVVEFTEHTANATIDLYSASINTSATLSTTPGFIVQAAMPDGVTLVSLTRTSLHVNLGPLPISVASNQTYYLVARVGDIAGAFKARGRIYARRVR